jgi:hypothetical protein
MSPPAFHSPFDLPQLTHLLVNPGGSTSPPPAAPPDPSELQALVCAADRPLALFPVRLETRFFTLDNGARELRVRVYPDKIHLDSHEPTLLATERNWGVHYWEADWRAGDDLAVRKAAWRQLADRYGAARAAFIARQLRPINAAARPTQPTPADQPLSPAPAFPDPPTEPAAETTAWRSAPRARLLPSRWTAVLNAGGRSVAAAFGGAIASSLAVGPDPHAAPATGEDDAPVDDGMKWMVDFAAAEAAGMGLRIPLPGGVAEEYDSLLVFGVADTPSDQTGTGLAALLDAHHYTDGLELLRPGSATNNTADDRSAFSSPDPGHDLSFASEILPNPDAYGPDANARLIGAALGLSPGDVSAVLGRIGGAADTHALDAKALNTALWPTTWGYLFEGLIGLGQAGLSPDLVDRARAHFIDHVRGLGSFPPIRVGRQPYGILPTTSLDLFQPAADDPLGPKLRDLLLKLRDQLWRPHLGEVPRLGARTPPDPDADLAAVMATEAVSRSLKTRAALGRHYLQHLRAFLDEDLQASGFLAAQDVITGALPGRLGLVATTRLSNLAFADLAWPVKAPWVQAGPIGSDVTLQPDYIGDLLAAPTIEAIVGLRPSNQPGAPAASVLQTLLRHALLRELAGAAARIAATTPGADVAALLRENELIDLIDGAAPTPTWRRQLDAAAAAVTGQQTIRSFIEGQTTYTGPELAALAELRQALSHLRTLDTGRLDLLLKSGFDLASHRLDAWISAFAASRLEELRAAAPQGLYVGAYCWVENLQPGPAPQPVSPLPAGETGPLCQQPGDTGFIHAPSLTHATAAALLRNAHLGASGTPKEDSPFAIRLSSRRVREADALLSGMRQGQPLGALLGYRVERALHDLGLDPYIAPLREVAPLSPSRIETSDQPLETVAAANVVDGLELEGKWRDEQAAVRARLQQVGNDVDRVARELDRLQETLDGLADGLVAEAAYQMARGNPTRLAASLASVSQGDAAPPELEVARIPRSGLAVTHRVVLLTPPHVGPAPGWAGPDRSFRAAAEPALDAWVGRLLGDPGNVRCTIQLLDGTGQPTGVQLLKLADLGLGALDVVYAVEPVGSADGLSELEQRVLYAARRTAGAAAGVRLQRDRPTDLVAGELTLLDVVEQARAARRLIQAARPAEPGDFAALERDDPGTIDLGDLDTRAGQAESSLMIAVAKASSAGLADDFRTAIVALGGFGLSPAIPLVPAGDDASAVQMLAAQAASLVKTARARLDAAAKLKTAAVPADPRARAQQLCDRLAAIFGADFLALRQFTCGADTATEFAAARAGAPAALSGKAAAVEGWLLRAARVRDRVARLSACFAAAEALGTGQRLGLRLAQLPFDTQDPWIGMTPPINKALPAGKVSVVIQASGVEPDLTQPLAGLWVDEWAEVVPTSEETTAVTFAYDPPDSMAPQAVLLAVPPVLGQDWTAGALHRVLLETLDLAKLRGVDPESLGDAAQYLPATYLAFNVLDDAVSSDPAPLIL